MTWDAGKVLNRHSMGNKIESLYNHLAYLLLHTYTKMNNDNDEI